jgi:hypothetical protein
LYYLNSEQAANLIDKKGSAMESYIIQNALSSMTRNEGVDEMRRLYREGLNQSRNWDPSVFVENGNNYPYRVIPIKDVIDFLWFHLNKGNQLAKDLIYLFSQESLQIRCEAALVGVSPNVVEIQKDGNHWLACRNTNKSVHASFINFCRSNGLNGALVHDEMTKHIFGQSAEDARTQNQLVGTDKTIGLDYQDNYEGQLLMAKVKLKFMGYRKGTWKERVGKAFYESI